MSMPEVRMVAEAAERFNRAVYGELRKEKGNILISPHGVAAVLAMVAEGEPKGAAVADQPAWTNGRE